MNETQWNQFYLLCDTLGKDLVILRKESDITGELIGKRDEVYHDMMKDSKLQKKDYLEEMGKRLNLSDK